MPLKCTQGLTCLHGRPESGGRAGVMAWDTVPFSEVRFPTARKRLHLKPKSKPAKSWIVRYKGLRDRSAWEEQNSVSLEGVL